MENSNDVWSVLSEIQAMTNANPPNERTISYEAQEIWRRREKSRVPGSADDDWFGAIRLIQRRGDLCKIENRFSDAQRTGDREMMLSLAVVWNLAVFWRVRPTEIGCYTPVDLEWEEKGLISAGISAWLGVKFRHPGFTGQTVGCFITVLMNEYERMPRRY